MAQNNRSRSECIQSAISADALKKFQADLAELIAFPTEPGADAAHRDCQKHITGWFENLDFSVQIFDGDHPPVLLASRIENPSLPTLLSYSHADTVPAMTGDWAKGLTPWDMTVRNGMIYGRGVADNKGQLLVNLAAIRTVLQARGRLGFNLHWLVEMGEEVGSPGLDALCGRLKHRLQADLFLASDGPRLSADQATVFLGARGGFGVELAIQHRKGGRHSGNFGGLLRNPGTEMAHVLASIIGPDGACLVPGWVPDTLPEATRAALAGLVPAGGEVDENWGTPGLTPAQRVYGWSAVEVLSFSCGNPVKPVNAIPDRATADIQLRYVTGLDEARLLDNLRDHLNAQGFDYVKITPHEVGFPASATPVTHPFVNFITTSMARTTGTRPAILPSLGGSLPNHVFTKTLGLPAIWVPHSYPACNQHAPDEHVPLALFVSAIKLMTGIFFDLGAADKGALGL